MSFTRFHDDPCRVEKKLQESTGAGRYMLNVPGNGSKPCFMEDPYIRLQQWGANLMTNPVDLDSKLRGLTTNLNRDCITDNDNVTNLSQSQTVNYPVCNPTTEQPRATHPAWTARDLEQVNWYTLPQDPQKNVLIPFENNVDTRMMERDNFVVTTSCPTQVIDPTK